MCMELEEILQKENGMKNIFFFFKRMGIGMLTSILPLLLFSSRDVRCGLVDVYHRDV